MILIQDMGCFINVELKPPKKGEAVLWYECYYTLREGNIVKGKLLVQTFLEG